LVIRIFFEFRYSDLEFVILNMNLACHIRSLNQLDRLANVQEHLKLFYPLDGTESAISRPEYTNTACTRIYVGDEFCVARMPSLAELKRIGRTVVEKKRHLTLLTPVMADEDLEGVAPLFRYLNECHTGAEIVFNDWGVMVYLATECPALTLSAGRVLNKGFKDPRLKPAPGDHGNKSADGLLNWSTFDGPWIRDKLLDMDINRCEQDLLPYQTAPAVAGDRLETSIYFPFGYVTSGRICWTASFDQAAGKRFMPPGRCSRPCGDFMLELKNTDFRFRLFQSGNTIFYLYPPDRLTRLLQTARSSGQRLVYQGFGFEAP
jgi:hypothetical protein